MNKSEPDVFGRIREQVGIRVEDHAGLRSSDPWKAEQKHLARLTFDFVEGIRASVLAFTRCPEANKWLLQSSADDLIETAIAIHMLATNGALNAGRRELRYLLELAVKAVFVDQQLPASAELKERQRFTHTDVPRSSAEVIGDVKLLVLPAGSDLPISVKNAFGMLSGYVHVSIVQLEERTRRERSGRSIGFESIAEVRAHTAILSKVFDMVLALEFIGIGGMFTGDVLDTMKALRPDWKFFKTRYVAEVARTLGR